MSQPAALALPTVAGKHLGPLWGGCALAGLLFTATLSGPRKQLQSASRLSAILVSYFFLSFALMGFPGCASSWLFISWHVYKSPCLICLEFYRCLCCCLNPPTLYSHLSLWTPWQMRVPRSFSIVPCWTYGKGQSRGVELLVRFYLFNPSSKLGRTRSLAGGGGEASSTKIWSIVRESASKPQSFSAALSSHEF